MQDDTTLITAFFDIGRDKWLHYRRSIDEYFDMFAEYMNIPQKMLIYVDDRYKEKIKNILEKDLYRNKKVIFFTEKWMKENIYSWSKLDKEIEISNNAYFKSLLKHRSNNPEVNNPLYTIMTHSKIDFVVESLKHIDTQYVAWNDFGGLRKWIPKNIIDIKKLDVDRINVCSFVKLEEINGDVFFNLTNAPEIFHGCFFFASRKIICKYQEMYHNKITEFQNMGIMDDDQHIMLQCVMDNQDLFKVWVINEWCKCLWTFQK